MSIGYRKYSISGNYIFCFFVKGAIDNIPITPFYFQLNKKEKRWEKNFPRIFREFSENFPRIFREFSENFPRIFREFSFGLAIKKYDSYLE